MSENDPSLLEVLGTIVDATLFHIPLEEMVGVQLISLLLVAGAIGFVAKIVLGAIYGFAVAYFSDPFR